MNLIKIELFPKKNSKMLIFDEIFIFYNFQTKIKKKMKFVVI